jgi:hypothetical protein
MLFPDINEYSQDTNGLIIVSDYDRAFLLSIIQSRLFFEEQTNDENLAYIDSLEHKLMADVITQIFERIATANEAQVTELQRIATAVESIQADKEGEEFQELIETFVEYAPLLVAAL